MRKTIDIIIPVHNSLSYTKKCLAGLEDLTAKASSDAWRFEVVLVDDGSDDGTAEWVRAHHPAVHLCFGDGNLWWSGGINLGMQYALNELQTDYILWWNNDIHPANDYFDQLTNLLQRGELSTVYGSKIYKSEPPGVIWSFGGFFHHRWGYSFSYGKDLPDGDQFSKPLEADWLPGMGSVFSREIIETVGEVNAANFPQYHADVDYTCRVRKTGHKLIVEPKLRIWNDTGHTGQSHELRFGRLLPALYDIQSPDHFRKEWLLYRKHAPTPLAFLVVIKKYIGYFLNFLKNKLFF